MTIRDKAEAALEEAVLRKNGKPLENLVAMLLLHMGVEGQDLEDIRSDVFFGLAKMWRKNPDIPSAANQFYTIVDNNRKSYFRKRGRSHPSVQFESVESEVERKLQGSAFVELSLSPDQDEKIEAVERIVSAMGSSGNETDRKRYLALVATFAGEDPVKFLRAEFGPDIAANTAAQHKHRGIEQVKAQYQASKGRKAS
jgi:DNA-directed RNA polymerase specialized sigma24 family protein